MIEHAEPLRRVCVLLPTFNEVESLEAVVRRLRVAAPAVDVAVIDDNSPDGTGALADRLAEGDDQVHVLHRPGKEGLGAAYLAGFDWATRAGYDAVVEMDADGSHLPEQLSRLLEAATDADVVIGSRWVRGGAIHRWPWHRRVLSRGGNAYVRAVLGVEVMDATAGFRVYRTSALTRLGLEDVTSHGYCFQVDLTLRAIDEGLRVVEVPIDFWEREHGRSKMGGDIVLEALGRVTSWGLRRRVGAVQAGVGSRLGRARGGEGKRQRWHQLPD